MQHQWGDALFEALQIIHMVAINSKRLTKFLIEQGVSPSHARQITSDVRKQVCYSMADWETVADSFAEYAQDLWNKTGLTDEAFERFCDFFL